MAVTFLGAVSEASLIPRSTRRELVERGEVEVMRLIVTVNPGSTALHLQSAISKSSNGACGTHLWLDMVQDMTCAKSLFEIDGVKRD